MKFHHKSSFLWLLLGGVISCLCIFAWAGLTLENRSTQIDLAQILTGPSFQAWFGRDELGRDVFSRVLVGGARTLFPSLLALLLISLLGTLLGLISAKLGGLVDRLVQVFITVFQAFPPIILVISLVGFLGLGMKQTIIAICLTSWTKYAYLVRSLIVDTQTEAYMEYAGMFGNSFWRKVRFYDLPNLLPQLLTTMAYDVNTIVMEIAGLSFIGLGTQLPYAEWGSMINAGRTYLQTAPWLVFFPSLFLVGFIFTITLLAKNLKTHFEI